MNNRKNLLAVMDIGSSKINCLQCFTDNNEITKVCLFVAINILPMRSILKTTEWKASNK